MASSFTIYFSPLLSLSIRIIQISNPIDINAAEQLTGHLHTHYKINFQQYCEYHVAKHTGTAIDSSQD